MNSKFVSSSTISVSRNFMYQRVHTHKSPSYYVSTLMFSSTKSDLNVEMCATSICWLAYVQFSKSVGLFTTLTAYGGETIVSGGSACRISLRGQAQAYSRTSSALSRSALEVISLFTAPRKCYFGVRVFKKIQSDCRATTKAPRTATIGVEQTEKMYLFVNFSVSLMIHIQASP